MSSTLDEFEKKYGEYGLTATTSNLVLVPLFCALLFLAYNTGNIVVNYLIIILGAACGWAVGIFYSPYNRVEEDKFSAIGRTISVFVSGYALSKFDRFLEKTLFDEAKDPVFDIWMRLGFFAGTRTNGRALAYRMKKAHDG